MDTVIPAAGRSSRLGELTADRPRGLVEVAGRSLLAHVFETAVDGGGDEVIVIVGYGAGQIVDRFSDTFEGVPITYVHQRERLGLKHAVLQTDRTLMGSFFFKRRRRLFQEFRARNRGRCGGGRGARGRGGVARGRGDDRRDRDGRDGAHEGIVEKPDDPPSTLVTTGCYVLPEDVFHACALLRSSAEGEYQLSEAVGLLMRAGYEVATVRVGGRVNVNTPADVERAAELVRGE